MASEQRSRLGRRAGGGGLVRHTSRVYREIPSVLHTHATTVPRWPHRRRRSQLSSAHLLDEHVQAVFVLQAKILGRLVVPTKA